MSVTIRLPREKTYARRVKYSGDGYLIHDLYLDQITLKQLFHGQIPDEMVIIIQTPEDKN